MKKFLSFLLVFLMLSGVLCSCNFGDNKSNIDANGEAENNDNENANKDDGPELSDAEKAMKTYYAVINGEIDVFDQTSGEIALKDIRFPTDNKTLGESKILYNAILDLDGDGINEYVIKSPSYDFIVLRYYNEKVYSYRLESKDFYDFNTDGTFYSYESSTDNALECGLNEITFDGEKLNIKSLYMLKYNKETSPIYEYYVDGKAVTHDEYEDYTLDMRKKSISFSHFELTHSYPISAQQAWDLANEYWDNQDSRAEQSAGTIWTARIVLNDTPSSSTKYYTVTFQINWSSGGAKEGYECMPPYDISLKDQILVNAFTGEITTPAKESGSECISVEEAIEIAKMHQAYGDGDRYDESKYRFEHAIESSAPEHVHTILIKKYDTDSGEYYVTSRIWVDKYTGKTVEPYYMNGK